MLKKENHSSFLSYTDQLHDECTGQEPSGPFTWSGHAREGWSRVGCVGKKSYRHHIMLFLAGQYEEVYFESNIASR